MHTCMSGNHLQCRIVALILLAAVLGLLSSGCGHSHGHGISPTLVGPSALDPQGARQPTETTLAASLAELDALPIPAGVDAGVFAELRSALARQLRTQNSKRGTSRLVATPPAGEANRVNDLSLTQDESGEWHLSWHYRCSGDYNQDGLVSVGDIMPLAVHFGESVERDPLNEVIDGNGDGVIGIADITAIARHFLVEVADYRIEAASESGGAFALVDTVGLPEGERTERLQLSFAIESAEPANFYRVVPEDAAGNPGDASNRVGLPPKILDVGPLIGGIEAPFNFTASVRGAPPITYHWVFGGDATPVYSFENAPAVSFTTTGLHPVSLTISNLWGSDSFEFTVQVTREGDWRMFGHDPQHTGRSAYRGPEEPVLAWSFQTGDAIASSVAVAPDGSVYFRSHDGYLYALDAFGQIEWTRDGGPNGYASAAVADDGFIYIGSDYGFVGCVDPEDGT